MLAGGIMSLIAQHGHWADAVASAMSRKDSANWSALVDPYADSRLPAILWELSDNPGAIPLFMNTWVHEVSMNGPLCVPLVPGGTIANWILSESVTAPVGCTTPITVWKKCGRKLQEKYCSRIYLRSIRYQNH